MTHDSHIISTTLGHDSSTRPKTPLCQLLSYGATDDPGLCHVPSIHEVRSALALRAPIW